MGAMAYQITSLTIVYSTVYSSADQRKHQSSASLAFVRGIHRSPVNSPHKRPVTRKMFPFDDVIMYIRGKQIINLFSISMHVPMPMHNLNQTANQYYVRSGKWHSSKMLLVMSKPMMTKFIDASMCHRTKKLSANIEKHVTTLSFVSVSSSVQRTILNSSKLRGACMRQ